MLGKKERYAQKSRNYYLPSGKRNEIKKEYNQVATLRVIFYFLKKIDMKEM